jgi:hypothetical protein
LGSVTTSGCKGILYFRGNNSGETDSMAIAFIPQTAVATELYPD